MTQLDMVWKAFWGRLIQGQRFLGIIAGVLLAGAVHAQNVHYEFEGNANDSAGSNHATTFGAPTYTAGPIGQAINLDGASDYVQLPANIANYTDITVAAWVRWDGIGGSWQRIFDFGANQNTYMFLTPYSGAGTLKFAITTSGSGGEQPLETSSLPVGQWVHVAVTLNGNTGTLYVDGVPADSGTIVLNPANITRTANYIGESQWPDPLFNGQIDDFRIYNYALSGSEITALVALGDPPVDPPADTISVDTTTDPVQTVDLSGTWDFNPNNASATTIQVPGGGWKKQGFTASEADYEKSITIPSLGQPQVTLLKFGAVNYQADLYIDNNFITSSTQSHTPATFDITDHVTPGGTYTVKVHVKGHDALMSNGLSLVPNGAGSWSQTLPDGIFRSAELLVYPQVFVQDVFVRPYVSSSNLYYDVWLRNDAASSKTVTLSGTLDSWNGDGWSYPSLPSSQYVLPADSVTKVTVGPVSWTLGKDSYWWPNVPYQPGYEARLHNLNLSLSGDASYQTSVRFGFRECTQGPDGMGNTCYFLNGIRVNFRGDSLQGANYDRINNGGQGNAFDTLPGFLPGPNGWPKAVDNYQRLNYNVVRIHQIPASPYMLEVCDEKGLMIIDETGIRGAGGQQDFNAGWDNMVNHVKALFARDRNHASVVRLSQSNEPDHSGTDSIGFENALYQAAMEVDGTRPISIDAAWNHYDSMTYNNFSVFTHYGAAHNLFGAYTDEVFARTDRPYGSGEFIWDADNTAQGFTWFGTSIQAMRAKGASDARPYTLLSAWASVIPGVSTTQMQLEPPPWNSTPLFPLYGENNLPDPWSNWQIQRLQAACNPVLVADAGFWEIFKGSNAGGAWPENEASLPPNTPITRTLRIYNDTFSDSSVDVFWELRQGSPTGAVATSGSFSKTVPPGYADTQNITFMTPSVANGTQLYLVLYSERDGVELFRETSQKFVVQQPVIASGIYKIINRSNGMALRANGGLGGNVDLVSSGSADDQRWVVSNAGGSQYYFSNVANPRYLDVYGFSTTDGGTIAVWDYTANNNQEWTIQSAGGGYYNISSVFSGKVLDVSGTDVVQWSANGGNDQDWSFELVMLPTPTGLAATPGENSVSLAWDAVPGATSYEVQRAAAPGGPYTTIGSPTTASHVDATALGGITYYYVVKAINSTLDDSYDSVEVSASLSDNIAPAVPTGLVATAGDSSVGLDWVDNVTDPDFDYYTVYRSTTSNGIFDVIASGLTVSTNTDNTVTNGIRYYYVVTAADSNANESAFSSPPVSAVPSAPIAPEEYYIADIVVAAGTNLTLTLSNSVVGHIYGILATDTLTPTAWSNIMEEAGTGSDLLFGVPIDPASTNRFFKLDVQIQ